MLLGSNSIELTECLSGARRGRASHRLPRLGDCYKESAALDFEASSYVDGEMARIRRMRNCERQEIKDLIARLDYEDQAFWRKNARTLEECIARSKGIEISTQIKGNNVILVAEEKGTIVGLCWCTIVDQGIDRQAEITEFYVKSEFRGRGIGKELINAARRVFIKEKIDVVFVWTHRDNKAVIGLYKRAGFKETDQLVMSLMPLEGRESTSRVHQLRGAEEDA